MLYDTVIIGGGLAGMQAALMLSRARRSVLLIDEGAPRHRFAKQMHNLVGADGADPAEFYGRAQSQLDAYPHCTRKTGQVVHAFATPEGGFTLVEADGAQHRTRTVLFACGIRDVLPAIEGMQALWGDRVLHCSYCHGYEVRDQRVGMLTTATHAWANMQSMLLLTNTLRLYVAGAMPDADLLGRIQALGVEVAYGYPVRVAPEGQGISLEMLNGERHALDALFVNPSNESNTQLPFMLGCERAPGGFMAVDEWGRANVPGIYAAGDVVQGSAHQFASAVKGGMTAALSLHTELMRADIG